MASSPVLLYEFDEVGSEKATYILSTAEQRVDVKEAPKSTSIWQDALNIFLPSGYPDSVSKDYIAYQFYDSLQAFSSSIASLLANRAVLEGIGVGDESASPTAAMLLSVLQESMGRLATIIFAHRLGTSLEPECKMWRLAADVLNDTAMILDAMCPMFPRSVRVPILSFSSVFRALCGVAAGSSKATLSSHFAQRDNIGELNAKDSSQETVISLFGMWAGSFVVSSTSSKLATWTWLTILLTIHLSTNYAAVKSVSMKTLNRQRTNIVFSNFVATCKVLSPDETAVTERIFERGSYLRWKSSTFLGTCVIGEPFDQFLCSFGSRQSQTGSIKHPRLDLSRLIQVFQNEDYLLWFNNAQEQAVICLKEGASSRTQIKAWSHALLMAQLNEQGKIDSSAQEDNQEQLRRLAETLSDHSKAFPAFLDGLRAAGWQLDTPALETNPGRRILLADQSSSSSKSNDTPSLKPSR